MKLVPRRSLRSVLVVSVLVAILVLLALLQIRWSDRVTQAERERMQAALRVAVFRFRRDFYAQLVHVCSAFQPERPGLTAKSLQEFQDRYENWMQASSRPGLVAGLFLWIAAQPAGRGLLHYNPDSGRFEVTPWPPELRLLRIPFRHDSPRVLRHTGTGASFRHWNLVEQAPALIHPLWTAERGRPARTGSAPEGFVVVWLNQNFMRNVLFPMLAERYFHGPSDLLYRVSVDRQGRPEEILSESAPSPGDEPPYTADVIVSLLPAHPFVVLHSTPQEALEEDQPGSAPASAGSTSSNPAGTALQQSSPLVFLAGGAADWRLTVRRRSGSVQAAIAQLRRRDLGVSLGMLAVLGVSMALILISAQRAQRLARMQMDFVAGISHELRTPLAVICSAAENLADGVVGSGEAVKNYGALIRREGRRLAEMVEQTLGFAAQQARPQQGERRPTEVAAVIERALAQTGSIVDPASVPIEKHIEPHLPQVMADAPGLTRCILNLITNAIKYGGERPWVGIRARSVHSKRGTEVEIAVEDRGIGIARADLPHIFEPFYRGKSNQVAQIHGTGLGLSLAQDIAEALGGSLGVTSELGKGSIFSLRLPALPPASPQKAGDSAAVDRRQAAPHSAGTEAVYKG